MVQSQNLNLFLVHISKNQSFDGMSGIIINNKIASQAWLGERPLQRIRIHLSFLFGFKFTIWTVIMPTGSFGKCKSKIHHSRISYGQDFVFFIEVFSNWNFVDACSDHWNGGLFSVIDFIETQLNQERSMIVNGSIGIAHWPWDSQVMPKYTCCLFSFCNIICRV